VANTCTISFLLHDHSRRSWIESASDAVETARDAMKARKKPLLPILCFVREDPRRFCSFGEMEGV
jgi:hypothetical protein